MARIKLADLDENMVVSEADLKAARGGFFASFSGGLTVEETIVASGLHAQYVAGPTVEETIVASGLHAQYVGPVF